MQKGRSALATSPVVDKLLSVETLPRGFSVLSVDVGGSTTKRARSELTHASSRAYHVSTENARGTLFEAKATTTIKSLLPSDCRMVGATSIPLADGVRQRFYQVSGGQPSTP